MEEDIKKRLTELADKAYAKGEYVYTDFLSLSEISEFMSIKNSLSYAEPEIFGGYKNAERAIIRFGFGYTDYPIIILKAEIRGGDKFSSPISHRDVLGALMNLGIERKLIGDILTDGDKSCVYIFCISRIADYICENLVSIGRSKVNVHITDDTVNVGNKREQIVCFLPSMRLDCIIGEVYKLSRSSASEYIDAEKVYINGKICSSASKTVKTQDVITVRGKGKFEVSGIPTETKKGRLKIEVSKYI